MQGPGTTCRLLHTRTDSPVSACVCIRKNTHSRTNSSLPPTSSLALCLSLFFTHSRSLLVLRVGSLPVGIGNIAFLPAQLLLLLLRRREDRSLTPSESVEGRPSGCHSAASEEDRAPRDCALGRGPGPCLSSVLSLGLLPTSPQPRLFELLDCQHAPDQPSDRERGRLPGGPEQVHVSLQTPPYSPDNEGTQSAESRVSFLQQESRSSLLFLFLSLFPGKRFCYRLSVILFFPLFRRYTLTRHNKKNVHAEPHR